MSRGLLCPPIFSHTCKLHLLIGLLLWVALLCQASVCAGEEPVQTSTRQISSTDTYAVSEFTFPSPVQDNVPPNGLVYVRYWQPKAPGSHPAVILLHHWGAIKPFPELELAKDLVTNGIAVVMPTLPYHMQRNLGRKYGARWMISSDVPHTVKTIQQAVAEAAALREWLANRPEVDSTRIGIAGISLGAILAALTLEQDKDFQVAALIVGGGNVADIMWHGIATFGIRRQLEKMGYTEERLARELAPVEPLNRPVGFTPPPTLMVNALYDPVVSRQDSLALWDAFGHPPIVWMESGHYMLRPARHKVDDLVIGFFANRFGRTSAFAPPSRVQLPRTSLGLYLSDSPIVSFGVSRELSCTRLRPFTIDGNLGTSGLSVSGGLVVKHFLLLGAEQKIFPHQRGPHPLAAVIFNL
jgi:hypothetical protein